MSYVDLHFYIERDYKLALTFSIASFFYVFVLFFLPFGVNNYDPNHHYTFSFFLEIFFLVVIIGVFTFLNEFYIKPFVVKTVSVKIIILWTLWTFVLLSTATFFAYNLLGNWHDLKLSSFLSFIPNCSSVFIFPTAGVFFYFRQKNLEEKIEEVYYLIEKPKLVEQLVTFSGQGMNDQISLTLSNFLYGMAQDNYVQLYYKKDSEIKRFLIRSSLTKLLSTIKNPSIIRCHRSYIVNLQKVETVRGGLNDLHITITNSKLEIPVSKTYREAALKGLKDIRNISL